MGLVTDILEPLRTLLGIAAEQWLVGAQYLAQHDAPPRYVWVPRRERFGPARRVGGNAQRLAMRTAIVECHLWGTDLLDAETRLEALIATVVLLHEGSHDLGDGDWDRPQQLDRGYLVVQTIGFQLAVTAPAKQTVTITSQDHVGNFQNAAGTTEEEVC